MADLQKGAAQAKLGMACQPKPAEAFRVGGRRLEAPGGFEPPHRSFADCSLSHLGTAPRWHYNEAGYPTQPDGRPSPSPLPSPAKGEGQSRMERMRGEVCAIAGLINGVAWLIPYCARHHPLH
jgi:hypothetical protein